MMGGTVGTYKTASVNTKDNVQILKGYIVNYLVVCSLDK
jgi:hypothetical protein